MKIVRSLACHPSTAACRHSLCLLATGLYLTAIPGHVHAGDSDDGGEAPAWSFSGSISVANNEVVRGLSRTDENWSVSAGATVTHATGLYAGISVSNAAFTSIDGDDVIDGAAVGFSAGLSNDIPNTVLSYDVGATYHVYAGEDEGSNLDYWQGGLKLTANYDAVSPYVAFYYSPDYAGGIGNVIHIQLGFSAPVPIGNDDRFSLSISGKVAWNKFYDIDFSNYWNWNLGLTLSIRDWVDLDVHYYDTSYDCTTCGRIGKEKFVIKATHSF